MEPVNCIEMAVRSIPTEPTAAARAVGTHTNAMQRCGLLGYTSCQPVIAAAERALVAGVARYVAAVGNAVKTSRIAAGRAAAADMEETSLAAAVANRAASAADFAGRARCIEAVAATAAVKFIEVEAGGDEAKVARAVIESICERAEKAKVRAEEAAAKAASDREGEVNGVEIEAAIVEVVVRAGINRCVTAAEDVIRAAEVVRTAEAAAVDMTTRAVADIIDAVGHNAFTRAAKAVAKLAETQAVGGEARIVEIAADSISKVAERARAKAFAVEKVARLAKTQAVEGNIAAARATIERIPEVARKAEEKALAREGAAAAEMTQIRELVLGRPRRFHLGQPRRFHS